MIHWADIGVGLIAPPIGGAAVIAMHTAIRRWGRTAWRHRFDGRWRLADLVRYTRFTITAVPVYLLEHDYSFAAGAGITIAAAFIIHWWRKNRRRVQALIGAKSRALRDALTTRMPRPRSVLQGGAP